MMQIDRLGLALLPIVLLWLTGQVLFQLDFSPAIANLAQMVAFLTLLTIYINATTRRPHGIDPNRPERRASDPFALTTEELVTTLPDGKLYGRRSNDDKTLAARIKAAARAGEYEEPAWVAELKQGQEEAA